jgi:hypothetical protein
MLVTTLVRTSAAVTLRKFPAVLVASPVSTAPVVRIRVGELVSVAMDVLSLAVALVKTVSSVAVAVASPVTDIRIGDGVMSAWVSKLAELVETDTEVFANKPLDKAFLGLLFLSFADRPLSTASNKTRAVLARILEVEEKVKV